MTGKLVPGVDQLLTLGADVPLCMAQVPTLMRGIGDILTPWAVPGDLCLILINPRRPLATGAVFQTLRRKESEPMTPPPDPNSDPGPDPGPDPGGADWINWLVRQRNDLEVPAISLQPVIGQVLDVLRGLDGCRLARMSGSGATCFAIMRDETAQLRGVAELQRGFPDWWVKRCGLYQPG